jgi:hypothetical protein
MAGVVRVVAIGDLCEDQGEEPPPAVYCRRGSLFHNILRLKRNFGRSEAIFAEVSKGGGASLLSP